MTTRPGRSDVAADAARRLNVFGGGFGLALNDHQAEPHDVEANGNHVGRERDIDRSPFAPEDSVQPLLGLGHVVRRLRATSAPSVRDLPIGERRILGSTRAAMRSVARRVDRRTSSSTIRRAPPSSRSALK